MAIEKVKFSAGNEELVGIKYLMSDDDTPRVLFLHGAGEATKERSRPLAKSLLDMGINSFAFDFSGHGESAGELRNSSIEKRVNEAKAALKFVDTKNPINLIGFSMGAHVAIKLSGQTDVGSLILFYPSVYSCHAYKLKFNESFTKEIRRKDSWKESDTKEVLQKFKGNLLVIAGEKDEVVPAGISDFILDNAVNAREKEKLIIPNGPHQLLPLIFNNTKFQNTVLEKITEYLS